MWRTLGQPKTVDLLQRAVRLGAISHAYLLVGPPTNREDDAGSGSGDGLELPVRKGRSAMWKMRKLYQDSGRKNMLTSNCRS